MATRSPARLLAPLALVAFVVALYLVVTTSNDPAVPQGGEATETRPAGSREGSEERERSRSRPRRTYRVQPGDTPSAIAEKTGVPLDQIERLNPDLDPQALAPGTRIRLRQ